MYVCPKIADIFCREVTVGEITVDLGSNYSPQHITRDIGWGHAKNSGANNQRSIARLE